MTSRRSTVATRYVSAAVILAALVWRVGAGPFLEGLRRTDGRALGSAVVIGAITTLCCAWRWRTVCRGLGLDVNLQQATAAYYRSLFLNTVLPTGVAGDVHRAVRHGRDAGDVGLGVRSVAWERTAGQAVQVGLTIVVLLIVPSPVRSWMPAILLAAATVVAALVAFLRFGRSSASGRVGQLLRTAHDDLRQGLLARHAWPVVLIASVVIVLGHVATFVIAARTAGAEAPVATLASVALLVLAAMAIPLSIAGWGPREGAAAWAFGAVGLGAAAGIATAVVYGLMALAASLPGAVVLLAARGRGVASEEAVHG